jgi:hypothetical protein
MAGPTVPNPISVDGTTGVFTFPSTGFYSISINADMSLYGATGTFGVQTTTNGTNWSTPPGSSPRIILTSSLNMYVSTLRLSGYNTDVFECTDTSTHKIKCSFVGMDNGNSNGAGVPLASTALLIGSGHTKITIMKIGDIT